MTRLNTQGRVHSVKRAHLSLLGHHSSYVSPLAQNPRQTLSFYKLENGKIFIFHSSSAVKNWRSLVSSDSFWNKGQRRFFLVYARLTCPLWPGLKPRLVLSKKTTMEESWNPSRASTTLKGNKSYAAECVIYMDVLPVVVYITWRFLVHSIMEDEMS